MSPAKYAFFMMLYCSLGDVYFTKKVYYVILFQFIHFRLAKDRINYQVKNL
jgi:hypothetical protein